MQKFLISLGICITLSIHLNAQFRQEAKSSFDCAKATTKVEKIICSDSSGELQRLDFDMAKQYKQMLKNLSKDDK